MFQPQSPAKRCAQSPHPQRTATSRATTTTTRVWCTSTARKATSSADPATSPVYPSPSQGLQESGCLRMNTHVCVSGELQRPDIFSVQATQTLVSSSSVFYCFSFTTGLVPFRPFRMPSVPSKQTSKGSKRCSRPHLETS